MGSTPAHFPQYSYIGPKLSYIKTSYFTPHLTNDKFGPQNLVVNKIHSSQRNKQSGSLFGWNYQKV